MTEFGMLGQDASQFAQVVQGWKVGFENEQIQAPVDFRLLAPDFAARDRFTHLMHPYPAKLIPEIPHLFLRSGLAKPGKRFLKIVDPFCGSGTVLVEGVLAGCDVFGADANPLARLIARVKTRPIDVSRIKRSLVAVRRLYYEAVDAEAPAVVNIQYWYSSRIIEGLSKLRSSISCLRSEDVREFMLLCLSVCARRLSYADPRLSVPVKIKRSKRAKYGGHYRQLDNQLKFLRSVDVLSFFSDVALKNAERLSNFSSALSRVPKVSIFDDAIGLERQIVPGTIDLVITSPPYLGAQKYIRASSLSLGWLDIAYENELRNLERKNFGREHFSKSEIGAAPRSGILDADRLIQSVSETNPLRAHIAWTYLSEMDQALRSIFSILREHSYALIVLGPNTICGKQFDTPRFIEMLAHRVGFTTKFQLSDHIRSRGLMTKRNKTAGLITNEVVLCLKK